MSDVDRAVEIAPLAPSADGPGARFGVGTALFGQGGVSQDEARHIVRTAVGAGIRSFDSAPLYGWGSAERTLGTALEEIDRERVVLSTKVGRLLDEEARSVPFDFSRDGILRSWEASLRRLGQERVDILYLHDPDDENLAQGLSEAYPAMAELRSQGAVRAIGVGVNDAGIASKFVRDTDIDLVLIAGRYTLLDRSAEAELLPAAATRGVSLIVGGVFNSGVLATGSATSTFDYRMPDAETMAGVAALRAVCESFGVPLRTAAMRFPGRNRLVASTLLGVASAAELAENIDELSTALPSELWPTLDACLAARGAA